MPTCLSAVCMRMAGTGPAKNKKCVTFTELKGLSDEWDKLAALRSSMRDVGTLAVERPKPGQKLEAPAGCVWKTMDAARYNSEVLKPALRKMSQARHAVPDILALSTEVEFFSPSPWIQPLCQNGFRRNMGHPLPFGLHQKLPVEAKNADRTLTVIIANACFQIFHSQSHVSSYIVPRTNWVAYRAPSNEDCQGFDGKHVRKVLCTCYCSHCPAALFRSHVPQLFFVAVPPQPFS